GRVGLDPALREGSDTGTPLVLSHPEAKVSRSLISVARSLTHRPRGLGGMKLPLSVACGSGCLGVVGGPLRALVPLAALAAPGGLLGARGGPGTGRDRERVLVGEQLAGIGVAPGLPDDAARIVLAGGVLAEVVGGDPHLVRDRGAGVLDPAAGLAHPADPLTRASGPTRRGDEHRRPAE